MTTYRFCAQETKDAAISCKQCGSPVEPANSPSMADAPEIEMTPGMIYAGVKEFRSFRRDEDCVTEIVRAVYAAMHNRLLLDRDTGQATK